MTDIDFDELDRAVNSLIGAKPATDAPAPAPVADTSTSVQVTSEPSLQPVSSPAAVQPLAARRTSGRFMDVVHPSSDMRTSTPAPAESTTPEPQAPSALVTPTPSASDAQPHDMPDPLDFHGFEAPTPDADTKTDAPVSSTPLETPFIADAKVEKRPLGAFSAAATTEVAPSVSLDTEPSVQTPSEARVDAPVVEPEKKDEPADIDTPLPAELGDDLLSIESNENVPQQTEAPVAVTATTATDEQPPVVSITQQYAESPSTGDAPATTSIFDTDAYKKPLAHPKKKSSGWLVVLWIAILLIVGAGAGAAVYFYVLPLL